MMNTKIVQKCGCYEGDCVEILGLEVPLYACFTCGYAGVTPSGADNPHEDEVHVHDLLAEVERLRQAFLIATAHIGWGNHLGHNELRHALNSAGIDADSLSWADGEWSEEE